MKTQLNLSGLELSQKAGPLLFDIFAQPIVDLGGDNETAHLEFLTRFYTPYSTLISPDTIFLNPKNKPLFRDLDMIIIEEVLQRMQDTIPKWKYGENYLIGMNVSPTSIENQDTFLDSLENIFDKYPQVSKEKTHLEISERGDIHISEFVQNAYSRGFNISADDLGTQNFSIGRLRRDVIAQVGNKSRLKAKIDKSFIQQLCDPNNYELEIDKAYIDMVVAVKHVYPDIDIVAEGIETQQCADHINSYGINYAQGFFWGKPEKFTSNYQQPLYQRK